MRARARSLLKTSVFGLASLSMVRSAAADDMPWISAGDVPLPGGARSIEILRADEPLFMRPGGHSKRRGTAALGARLPIFGALRGEGCAARWLLVGPLAWVCESHVRFSPTPALAAELARAQIPDGLPHRYYFVGADGSLGYEHLGLAEEGIPDVELQPGFAVAITTIAEKAPGDPFGLTSHGVWLPLRDLQRAGTTAFQGETLDGKLELGWVFKASASVYLEPFGQRIKGQALGQFQKVSVLETKQKNGRRWFRVAEKHWLDERDLRVITPADLPGDVRANERWIDVDTRNQILTAYVGAKPVFATLVSTGKGPANGVQATPKGVYRLWVKLRSTDMDNLEDEDANRYYAMQSVPWVMFFQKGYGLHGTYWHRSFGNVRSHGCVNLSPLDAQRLFHWTSPRLPAGWTAVFPTEYERGTLVQVR